MPEISDEEFQRFQQLDTQNRALQSQVQQFQETINSLTPLREQLQQVSTERDTFRAQYETSQSENTSLRVGSAFDQALTAAGVLPQYRDRFSDQMANLRWENGAVTTADGASLQDFAANLRSQYPALFAAENNASGAGVIPTGPTSAPAPRVVTPQNGIISGVSPESVLKGEVKIS
jgi:chromosome segregation ATPase